MFIINITYKVPIEQIAPHMEGHIHFLDAQYAQGNFVASGRKVPRTGGIIFSTMPDKEQLMTELKQDPFFIHDLADIEVIEFALSKASAEFEFLIP